jgi:hypothetical protein
LATSSWNRFDGPVLYASISLIRGVLFGVLHDSLTTLKSIIPPSS